MRTINGDGKPSSFIIFAVYEIFTLNISQFFP